MWELVNDELGLIAALVGTVFAVAGYPRADPLAAVVIAPPAQGRGVGDALALRYAARQVPRDVLLARGRGKPRLLERLIGPVKR